MRFTTIRPPTAVAALMALVLSACSADSVVAPAASDPTDVTAAILPGNAYVIISDNAPGAGSFRSFIANNSGRTTTEFWDNRSVDSEGGPEKCNIGWYAIGAISPTCLNDDGLAAGSDANSVPGVYSAYLADGAQNRDATSFMFSGGSEYDVTLRGSYAGATSTVGWYTRSRSGVYTFHPITAWSNQTVNSTVTINTLGEQWGLYINNGFNPQPGGCATLTHCSDAEGGFDGMPFQQFALFTNQRKDGFLVGAEDNKLEIIDNTPLYDSDYNDYIWSVKPRRKVCDYVDFPFLTLKYNNKWVVISGNAGGISPDGEVMGEFTVVANGTTYRVREIDSYGEVTSGPLAGRAKARIFTGTATNGAFLEMRVWDGGEPGRNRDEVYLKINGVEVLGAAGDVLELGNANYRDTCRCGPRW